MTQRESQLVESHSDADTDISVVGQTQQYLEARARHVTPDESLVAAWDKFYDLYASLIRHFAGVCHLTGADLNDCVQEVWKDVIAALPRFQYDSTRGGFRCWLYMIVRHKAADVLRRKSRQGARSLSLLREAGLSSLEDGPACACERQWKRELVRSLLAELRRQTSEQNYRVLELRWLEGREVHDVAATLDLTPKQVRYRHHRMKQKLRQLFQARVKTAFGLEA